MNIRITVEGNEAEIMGISTGVRVDLEREFYKWKKASLVDEKMRIEIPLP